MKTSKPFATICYLDADTLSQRLARLIEDHPDSIANFAFVPHKAESDGKKPHIHLYIEPSGTLDTSALWFKETFYTLYNDEVVSSVKPWTSAKTADWILYAMHNEQYLMRKGLCRSHHYFASDFFVNDGDWFAEQTEMALATVRSCAEKMESCIREGLNLFQAMAVCGVSYGAMKSFADTYTLLKSYITLEAVENINQEMENKNV